MPIQRALAVLGIAAGLCFGGWLLARGPWHVVNGRIELDRGSWRPISTVGAPQAREHFTTVWTGSEMIVWGGTRGGSRGVPPDPVRDGARYDPSTDSWRPVSNDGAPSTRRGHLAVWTGSEMIVWDGADGGARYDPATDSWRQMARPPDLDGLQRQPAVWTGLEMIVWGGPGGGARYDPANDSWRRISDQGAPLSRTGHSLIWTGREVIVWGGTFEPPFSVGKPYWELKRPLGDGGRYDPQTDTWLPVADAGGPEARSRHVAIWTGAEMVIWGGVRVDQDSGGYWLSLTVRSDGAAYDPIGDAWRPLPDGPGAGRTGAFGFWTGRESLIWGGIGADSPKRRSLEIHGRLQEEILYDGVLLTPVGDRWRLVSTAPLQLLPPGESSRFTTAAVWTGSEVLVWGVSPDDGQMKRAGVGMRLTP